MKIEIEIDDARIQRDMQAAAVSSAQSIASNKAMTAAVGDRIRQAIDEVAAQIDFRAIVKAEMDKIIAEVVQLAVNNQIRGLAKTIVQQEIEKAKAAYIEPAKVRE